MVSSPRSLGVKKVGRKSVPFALFPLELRQYRDQRELNQRQLAQLLDVSQSCIYLWETGKRHPTISQLQRIGAVLKITWTL